MKRQLNIYFIATISFLLAMMLTILPLPNWANWLRPAWILMALIYWVIKVPNSISIEVAWILGLLQDILTGTTLGEHALILVIIAYFISKFYLKIRLLSLLQQSLVVFTIAITYQSLIFCTQCLTGPTLITWQYWLSSLTSSLLWPWLFTLLQQLYPETK
ncbi:MAG: hypothetical protein AMJ43_03965 [Coxiella sp. DG_40]|nr:MAG: hypothetical protein AMJ43_03965 [Coxiella sp. DG_40]